MRVIDLNGKDRWSLDGVRQRYSTYATQFQVSFPSRLEPTTHVLGETKWIYPVLEQVLRGVTQGDAACVQIAVDLVCDDARFAFGKIYKDKAATLLRRAALTASQQDQLRKRIVFMLNCGHIPPEYKCYARLLRSIGLGPYRAYLESVIPCGPRVRHYLAYFRSIDS